MKQKQAKVQGGSFLLTIIGLKCIQGRDQCFGLIQNPKVTNFMIIISAMISLDCIQCKIQGPNPLISVLVAKFQDKEGKKATV